MRGKACTRRGTLAAVSAGWRRALPLLTATLLLLPGGVAFAAEPIDAPTAERRCLVRCNQPEKPAPGARLQEATTKARTAVQEAREEVQEAREDAREAAGRVKEAAGEAREAVAEVKEASGDPKAALGEIKEGAGEVKDALTEPSDPAAEAHSSEQPPAQAPEQVAEPAPVVASAPAEPVVAPPVAVAPAQVTQADPSIEADSSAQAPVRRSDGVAGGPNTAELNPESGALGQSKATSPVAPADPAPAPAIAPAPAESAPAGPAIAAAAPPVAEPEAPVAAQAPPAVPSSAAAPDDVPSRSAPAAESTSTIALAGWSLPLAVAGGLLAGVALAVPMVRRQPRALGPGRAEGRALPLYDDRFTTHPGVVPAPGFSPTLLTRPVRPVTSATAQPRRDAVATASHVRLNGSPVPYLRPVPSRPDDRSAYTTNVAGLAWAEPATHERSDRALA